MKVVTGHHFASEVEEERFQSQILDMIIHEDFSENQFSNDICLVKIARLSDFDGVTRDIACLPEQFHEIEPDFGNRPTDCFVAGWGQLRNGTYPGRFQTFQNENFIKIRNQIQQFKTSQ